MVRSDGRMNNNNGISSRADKLAKADTPAASATSKSGRPMDEDVTVLQFTGLSRNMLCKTAADWKTGSSNISLLLN